MKKRILFLACCSLVTPMDAWAQEGDGFIVIVNSANETTETTEVDRSRLGKMFLKKVKSWPSSDLPVVPVDQIADSPVREAFTRAIHGKKVSAIKSYWQRMIFSGRDVPPPELDSDRSVIDFVRGEPGAVGYVTTGADLGAGVRELEGHRIMKATE